MPTLREPYRFGHEIIYLPLEAALFAALPNVIQHGEENLLKKTEFHVSLISMEEVILTVGATADIRHKEIAASVFALFNAFVAKTPLKVARLSDDVRFAIDREKKAILVRSVVSHLDEFFAQINKAYGVNVPVQPTHVTLYTLQPNVDIGITTEGQLNQYERIDVPQINRAIENVVLPS